MLCQICQVELKDEEDFKVHILAVHRQPFEYDSISLSSEDADVKGETSSGSMAGACSSKASKNDGLTYVPIPVEDPFKKKFLANFVYDNKNDQLPLPDITGGFNFNARNIQIWLVKFKELMSSRKMTYPLDPQIYEVITSIHKAIFDHYCCSDTSNDVTSSVFKVYEELDHILNKHFISINKLL